MSSFADLSASPSATLKPGDGEQLDHYGHCPGGKSEVQELSGIASQQMTLVLVLLDGVARLDLLRFLGAGRKVGKPGDEMLSKLLSV